MYYPTRETARGHAIKVVACAIGTILVMPNGSTVVLPRHRAI